MTSSSIPASFEDSKSFQGHKHNRSQHRKAVPERLPLGRNQQHNEDMFNVNGSLDHPSDHEDGGNTQNGFVTPMTSKFPPQDLSEMMSQRTNQNSTHTHSSLLSDVHIHHGLGVNTPNTAVQAAHAMLDLSYQSSKSTAVLVSILVSLPFVFISLVQVSPFELAQQETEQAGGFLLKARTQSRYLSFLGVCSLTAATLVTVGFVGELQGKRNAKATGKSSKNSTDKLISTASFKKILERILSIGLPFYAASKLGGERVAFVTLVSFAAQLGSKPTRGHTNGLWDLLQTRKWTFAALLLQCFSDLINFTTTSLPMQTLSGYLALSMAVLILPWPLPTSGSTILRGISDKGSRRNSNATSWEAFGASLPLNPLISSARDTDLTVASGVLATMTSFVVFILSSPETQTLTLKLLLGGSTVSIASAATLLFADSRALLPSTSTLSLALGLLASLVIQECIDSHPLLPIIFQLGLILASWIGVCLDTTWKHTHAHNHDHSHSHSDEKSPSRLTKLILHYSEEGSTMHKIFSNKDSRRIVYFLMANSSFMLVQGIYGYLTGSLGLLSDTVHMFFDCAALAVGLVAKLLQEQSASLQYPYGWKKMDALAGFGNGVLLLAISVEIVYEALERLASGSKLNRLGELLAVSTGGLLVNIFGLVAFGHHGHSHGHDHGHDHGHSHEHSHTHGHTHDHSHDHSHNHSHDHSHVNGHNHSHTHSHDHKENLNHKHANGHSHNASFTDKEAHHSPSHPPPLPLAAASQSREKHTHSHHEHGHSHGHGHGHSHGSDNMRGIYLHVLADMMGSISVMISTVLVYYTGWVGWDAVASVVISGLVITATVPLIKSTAKELVLYIPENTEFDLREALSGVGQLRGVVNITAPRFWIESGETLGVMHVVAAKSADLDDVRQRALSYLKGKDMDVLVQVEREGEGRCWCGGTSTTNSRAS